MPKLNILVPVVEAPPKRGCPGFAPKGFCGGCDDGAVKLNVGADGAGAPPWFPPNMDGADGCAGVPPWFPPNMFDGGAGEPLMPPRAAAALFVAPKLGFLITRPEGVVALDELALGLNANGLEASWPPPAMGAGDGAALVLFSPKVKLWLPGC